MNPLNPNTTSNIKTESGIQFLSRVRNPKFNLWNLEEALFIDKLKEHDIIELTADSVYLKNVLLMHILKQILLIDDFKGLTIGTHNCGVLFIDTAFHFNVIHLYNYLRKYVDTVNAKSLGESDKEEIVEKSLENLVYIPCYDSQQLLATFYHLRWTISSNPKIKLVVLDNVGANYWQDSVNGGLRRMDLYEKKLISSLQNCIKDLKLPIMYVRPDFFVSKHPTGSDTSTYRINVSGSARETYRVRVKTKTRNVEKLFVISEMGLKWA